MRDRSAKSSAGVGRTIADDIRRGDIRKNVKRDLRDMYEFYLDEDERARLAGMGRLKRWFSMVVWLAKSLLKPGRSVPVPGPSRIPQRAPRVVSDP